MSYYCRRAAAAAASSMRNKGHSFPPPTPSCPHCNPRGQLHCHAPALPAAGRVRPSRTTGGAAHCPGRTRPGGCWRRHRNQLRRLSGMRGAHAHPWRCLRRRLPRARRLDSRSETCLRRAGRVLRGGVSAGGGVQPGRHMH